MFKDKILSAFSSETAGRWMPFHRAAFRFFQQTRPVPKLNKAKSILVVRFDEIGDLVLSAPFLRELRRNAPNAVITLAVRKHTEALARLCPHVDRVLVTNSVGSVWSREEAFSLRMSLWRENLGWLFRRPYDLTLLPRRGPEHTGADFFAYTRGLGFVAGLKDEVVRANREARYREGFYERRFPVRSLDHEADFALRLIPELGGVIHSNEPEAWTTPADEAWADAWVNHVFDPSRPWAILHPSGGRSNLKQWPKERFVEVVNAVSTTNRLQWLVIGGPDERWIDRLFPSSLEPRVENQVGELTWGQLAALFKRSALFVGCDSGPTHLAAAAGANVIALFGPTSVVRFAPRGPNVRVLTLSLPCSPDQDGSFKDRCVQCIYDEPHCLTELPVTMVTDAVRKALSASGAPR